MPALLSLGSPSPSTGAGASLDAWEVDPPMGSRKGRTLGEVRQGSRGVIPRLGVVIAAIIVLPRDRLRGRFLEQEPIEALLVTAFLQRLLL
jgi:hypothetical protein